MNMKKGELQKIASELMQVAGPHSTKGYVEGKSNLKRALAEILDDEDREAAEVFNSLEERGFVQFINRVGHDGAEAHWRVVRDPSWLV